VKIERVKRLQDDDGHWYWIPEAEAKQFEQDLESLPELDVDYPSTYEAYGAFEIKYDKYRTGGSPDIEPDCFTEADQVIEVLVDRRND